MNVGHTVAHVMEKLSEYKVSNDKLSRERFYWKQNGWVFVKKTICEIERVVEQYQLTVAIPWPKVDLVAMIQREKKNRDRRIVFELPCMLGDCTEKVINALQLMRLL